MRNVATNVIAVLMLIALVVGVFAAAMGIRYACHKVVAPIFVGDDPVAAAVFCRPGR